MRGRTRLNCERPRAPDQNWPGCPRDLRPRSKPQRTFLEPRNPASRPMPVTDRRKASDGRPCRSPAAVASCSISSIAASSSASSWRRPSATADLGCFFALFRNGLCGGSMSSPPAVDHVSQNPSAQTAHYVRKAYADASPSDGTASARSTTKRCRSARDQIQLSSSSKSRTSPPRVPNVAQQLSNWAVPESDALLRETRTAFGLGTVFC